MRSTSSRPTSRTRTSRPWQRSSGASTTSREIPGERAQHIETALEIAEELGLPKVLSSALNTKSLILANAAHEADALVRQALRVALDDDLVFEALRAYNNLLIKLDTFDRPEESSRSGRGARACTATRRPLLGGAARGQSARRAPALRRLGRGGRARRDGSPGRHSGCDRRQRDPQPRTDRDRAGGAGARWELLPEITSDFEAGDFQQRGIGLLQRQYRNGSTARRTRRSRT